MSAEKQLVRWGPWETMVNLLDMYKIQYALDQRLKITDINVPASQVNHARLTEPISDEQVSAMELATQVIPNGLWLPALLAYRPGPGQPVILMDGNHRLSLAIRLGLTECWAYVAEGVEPRMVQEITRQANMYVGRGATPEDRMKHAVYLIRMWSDDKPPSREMVATAARACLFPVARVAARLRVEDFRDRMAQSGEGHVPGVMGVPLDVIGAAMGADDDTAAQVLVAGYAKVNHRPDREVVRSAAGLVKSAGRTTKARVDEAHKQVQAWVSADKAQSSRGPVAPTHTPASDRVVRELTRLSGVISRATSGGKVSAASIFTDPAQAASFLAVSAALRTSLQRMEAETKGGGNGVSSS